MDPTWATTDSEISVRASKRYISQCDTVKVRMDAEAGLDPSESLKEIQWNIHVTDMEIDEDLNFLLQRITTEAEG